MHAADTVPEMLEHHYFGVDDHEEVEAGAKAWEIVHKVLATFESQKIDDIVAAYTANYLVWRVAETIAEDMTDEAQVIKFLEMMNESNRAYINDVLAGWRHSHSESIPK